MTETVTHGHQTFTTKQVKRIAYNATRAALRGKVVSIEGFKSATHWDNPRIIVRLIEDDGSLGQEYLVAPHIIIDL